MTLQWLRNGCPKNSKLLQYEHIIYHFKAHDLEIPLKMMYNMSMLRHRFSNERWVGGGGAPRTTFLSYSVKVCIYGMTPKAFDMVKKSFIWLTKI